MQVAVVVNGRSEWKDKDGSGWGMDLSGGRVEESTAR